jgi:hypothetical protein
VGDLFFKDVIAESAPHRLGRDASPYFAGVADR